MLLKTDSLGFTEWLKEYRGDHCFSVIQTSDGGYLLGGYATGNNRDVFLVKTNSSGDTLWTRIHGTSEWEVCHEVIETRDHYYLAVGGYGEELQRWPTDPYIMKWDTCGNLIWERIIARPNDNTALAVTESPDSFYIIAGRTYEDQGQYNFWLMKMYRNGDTLWTQSYSRGGDEWAQSVVVTPDSGYLMCGWGVHSPFWYDVFLIKVKSNPGIIEEDHLADENSNVFQVCPNPFRIKTQIEVKFNCNSRRDEFNLKIYNTDGKLVKTIVPPIYWEQNYSLIWDGRDNYGNNLPNGVYFLNYNSINYMENKKLILCHIQPASATFFNRRNSSYGVR